MNKARDVSLEIKSINPYLGYIAWAEFYTATGEEEKCLNVLKDCITTDPYKVHAYIRLYHYVGKSNYNMNTYTYFLKMYLFIRDSRDFVEKYSEVRYRLMTLLFVRVAAIEGYTLQAINTVHKLYQEDGDKLAILIELARVVTEHG